MRPFFRLQEAKTSFFQRQFSSALKLFRNYLSWEGILSDSALKEIAISSLLNRYLLSAIRVRLVVEFCQTVQKHTSTKRKTIVFSSSSRYAIQQMRPPNHILLSIHCRVFGYNKAQSLPAWIYLYNFYDHSLPNWTNGIHCICKC